MLVCSFHALYVADAFWFEVGTKNCIIVAEAFFVLNYTSIFITTSFSSSLCLRMCLVTAHLNVLVQIIAIIIVCINVNKNLLFLCQDGMLSTPDITTEGFGFMLVFGDLVWVPFVFSLHTRFLAENTYKISPLMVVIVFMLNSK